MGGWVSPWPTEVVKKREGGGGESEKEAWVSRPWLTDGRQQYGQARIFFFDKPITKPNHQPLNQEESKRMQARTSTATTSGKQSSNAGGSRLLAISPFMSSRPLSNQSLVSMGKLRVGGLGLWGGWWGVRWLDGGG